MSSSTPVQRASVLVALVASIFLSPTVSAQAPITPGDLVVVRMGTGVGALTSAATPVLLDEYTPAGVLVQSISMPTVVTGSQRRLTNSGSATSEGALDVSVDGRYLVLAGYDAAPATASVASSASATVNRVVARVALDGTVDTSTALTSYSGNNVRSATSIDGNQFWVGGPLNGVSYVAGLGATSSTQVATNLANVRVVHAVGGQLYATSASGAFQGVSSVGVGLPTTGGNTVSILPGFPVASGPSSYDFFFADPNTVYVADDRATAAGGIQKWTLSAGTWSLQYTLQASANIGCRGLSGIVSGGVTTLYATTSAATLNQIVSVVDAGAGSPFTTLATAAANTIFRGIRRVSGATVESLGAGCPGTNNLVPVLSTTQLTTLGNGAFSVNLTQALPGTAAFLYGSIGFGSPPFDIGGGCSILLDIPTLLDLVNSTLFPIYAATDVNGVASFALAVPGDLYLGGYHVGLQVAVIDAVNPSGYTLTNALDCLLN